MSLQSWKDEFYPVDAESLVSSLCNEGDFINTKENNLKLIKHSINKWKGLREENLLKHRGFSESEWSSVLFEYEDDEEESFGIDSTSCSLCEAYYDRSISFNKCSKCPLYEFLGNPCYGEEWSPFDIWINDDNPEPMIDALQRTLDKLIE